MFVDEKLGVIWWETVVIWVIILTFAYRDFATPQKDSLLSKI
jgi:hypothetical protein